VNAIDTTAAGDAFAGYLGASLADGYERTDAIRRAIAAGALTVTRRGASPSIPNSDDVAAMLESSPA
jgi:ribokinase